MVSNGCENHSRGVKVQIAEKMEGVQGAEEKGSRPRVNKAVGDRGKPRNNLKGEWGQDYRSAEKIRRTQWGAR